MNKICLVCDSNSGSGIVLIANQESIVFEDINEFSAFTAALRKLRSMVYSRHWQLFWLWVKTTNMFGSVKNFILTW